MLTVELWESVAEVRAAIDRLPFIIALESGGLEPDRFEYYMGQDALYLARFARVLAAAAAQSPTAEDLLFWADSAGNAIRVERQLHARHVHDFAGVTMSPTNTAYSSYLLALSTGGSYPALVAGLLPCFWIYQDVGQRLLQRLGALDGHPYADWISTYADPGFAAATVRARAVVDAAAASGGPGDLDRMREAFLTASRYEHRFWDAAWRRETWTND